MEIDKLDKIYAFDTLYTANYIQILKIMLPYTNVSIQKTLAIFIKYLEFQYIIKLPSHAFKHPDQQDGMLDSSLMIQEIKPLCNPEDQVKLDQMLNMLQSFEMFSQMQEMMSFMGEMQSSNEQNDSTNLGLGGIDFSNISSLLSGMLSPDQMAMFEMFQQGMDT